MKRNDGRFALRGVQIDGAVVEAAELSHSSGYDPMYMPPLEANPEPYDWYERAA